MAVTRKMLELMGLEADKVQAIIDAHTEVTDALKADRDKFKAEAEKTAQAGDELAKVKKELEDLKAVGGDWEKKYTAEHEAFEAFKKAEADKATKASKESAYKGLLESLGVNPDVIPLILKGADHNAIEIDDAGTLTNTDTLTEAVKANYSQFIVAQEIQGADVKKGGGDGKAPINYEGMSMADYIKARNAK